MSYIVKRAAVGPRVRGLRSRLLPLDSIYSLAHSKNLEEFANSLRGLGVQVPERLDPLNIRRSIRRAYLNRLTQLYASSAGDSREVIEYHLIHWEYDNIKAIARGLALGVDMAKIERELDMEVEEMLRRRHIIAFLLASRDLEDLRERARRAHHPVHSALGVWAKMGASDIGLLETLVELSYFDGVLGRAEELKDRGLNYVVNSLMKYVVLKLAVRSRAWDYPYDVIKEVIPRGFSEYAQEVYARQPQQIIQYIVEVLPESAEVGKLVPEPTIRGVAVALDNVFPIAIRKITDSCIVRYSEFSLGSLYACLELVKEEANLLSVLGGLIAEGVEVVKRLEAIGCRAK